MRVENFHMAIEETLCPDCNSKMISRTGKFGVFWGCSKFPDCKGTRDSQGRSKADRQAWKDKQEETKELETGEQTAKERGKKEWNVK